MSAGGKISQLLLLLNHGFYQVAVFTVNAGNAPKLGQTFQNLVDAAVIQHIVIVNHVQLKRSDPITNNFFQLTADGFRKF